MLRSSILSIVALAVLGAAVAQAQQGEVVISPKQGHGQIRIGSDGPRVVAVTGRYDPGDHWLGVMCVSVDPAMRAHLNLPEKQGLIVMGVIPNSPAAKAGIRQHDILLRFGERPLGDQGDLLKAIVEAKEAAKPVELIRGGKRQTVEVSPGKRPEQTQPQAQDFTRPASDEDWAIVQRWLEGMKTGGAVGGGGRPPVSFRFVHPGAIVSGDVTVSVSDKPMPADLSVNINKNGDKPAQIEVRRGNDSWKVTENDLDKLPKDIRPFVERMFGHGPIWVGGTAAFDAVPDVMMPATTPKAGVSKVYIDRPGQMQVAPMGGFDRRLEQHFNEMNRRMDRMLKLMEQMLQNHLEENDEADD